MDYSRSRRSKEMRIWYLDLGSSATDLLYSIRLDSQSIRVQEQVHSMAEEIHSRIGGSTTIDNESTASPLLFPVFVRDWRGQMGVAPRASRCGAIVTAEREEERDGFI
ncbi:hypothetical protein BHM03_00048148 [Ensete ventricosum]|nr:hypothetical protein BHM03_00048148 [Ensete ventricosum]